MNFGMKFVFSNLWLFKLLLKKLMPVISSGRGHAAYHHCLHHGKGADG